MMEDQQSASERVQRAKRQAFGKTPKVYSRSELRVAAQERYARLKAAAAVARVDPEARRLVSDALDPDRLALRPRGLTAGGRRRFTD